MIDFRRARILAIAPIIGASAIAIAIVAAQPPGAARDVSHLEQAAAVAAVPTAASAPVAAANSDPRGDAVSVHGHWTITVLDPDGSLVDRVEFENGFVGSLPVTRFLSRSAFVGYWGLRLTGTQTGPCTIAPSTSGDCTIWEAASGASTGFGQFANLQVSTATNVVGAFGGLAVRLAGTAIADNTTSIDGVVSSVTTCPTAALTACNVLQFTNKTLAANTSVPPVPVQAGQQIQVTVVISFS